MCLKVALSSLIFLANNVLCRNAYPSLGSVHNFSYNELGDHTMVTDSEIFPYVCAILRKSTYISAGALIDESWVLTAGDALFLVRESARELRVRLGSINYKKGGILTPIKLFEIHPYFSDTKPEFDIALIKLPKPVRLTPNLNPIRLQKRTREVTATHYIVTSWPMPLLQQLKSMEMIKRRRILTVSHLHPSNPEKCAEEMEGLDINATNTLMCLDLSIGMEPCSRDVGAPVVLNGILWGIISSWKPEDCELEAGPSFVTLVSPGDISSWIHSTVRGHRWSKRHTVKFEIAFLQSCITSGYKV
ncbi:hypodermin-A-like [Pectinophora gossypiella]|uniref:hypodermin-A-like n=1 Tax=Pectinophora gossypiella TaxID=13191 RepID=UPI00214F542C|nr:hypodermin-A-like [Pectinophora gossypiella]